ncbi:MAG: ribosomal protein S18-alanine N-acetyltransferase [Candidatus Saganbacteria bacterium]|nr:ribosomal protein S18-alanine N-acetyltransferase [Candidatus Saganbacteria bacterium]
MSEISIKLLSEKELPDVIAIENLSFSSPWKPEQFIKNLPQFYCAKIENKIVGFIGVEKVQDEARVIHMAVHPIYRRKGVGKKLLTECLKLKANKFILEVRESNIAAQNLYKSFGFNKVSTRKEYYNDNNEDALIMIYEKKPS